MCVYRCGYMHVCMYVMYVYIHTFSLFLAAATIAVVVGEFILFLPPLLSSLSSPSVGPRANSGRRRCCRGGGGLVLLLLLITMVINDDDEEEEGRPPPAGLRLCCLLLFRPMYLAYSSLGSPIPLPFPLSSFHLPL